MRMLSCKIGANGCNGTGKLHFEKETWRCAKHQNDAVYHRGFDVRLCVWAL